MKKVVSIVLSLLLAFTMAFTVVGCAKPDVEEVKLQAIGITKKPTKLTYVSGEKFDPTGMKVSAKYSDNTVKEITGYDYDKKSALTEDDKSVVIKYTEGSVTKTASLSITVNPGTDHVKYHEFADGKCSCGAVLFEAENADVQGTPTDNNDGFIVTNDKASNGKVVGNWRNGDVRWTAYVTTEKEIKDLIIGIRFAPTGALNAGVFALPTTPDEANRDNKAASGTLWAFEMRLNEQIVSWQTNATPEFNGSDYFVFTTLLTNGVTLNAGENKLELEPWDNYGMNIDYLFFNTSADAKITFSATAKNPDHKHEFVDGKCTCGALKLEAEDCEVTGTPTYSDGFYRPDAKLSGGKKVGGFGDHGDNKVFIKFTSDKAYENVIASFLISTGSIATPDGFVFYDSASKSTPISHETVRSGISGWAFVKSSAFSIKAGENVFVIEAYQSCQVDFDYFVFEGIPVYAVVTFEKYVVPAPDPEEHLTHEFTNGKCSCGAVKFEAEDCELIGTPAPWSDTGFYRPDAKLSGGKKVGAWGVSGDNRIYIKFTSDKAYENVTMTFRLLTGNLVNPTAFDFYFNETKATKIGHSTLSSGMDWTDVKSDAFNISAGENFLVIEAYQSCEVDWDYFFIEGLPADAQITFTKAA